MKLRSCRRLQRARAVPSLQCYRATAIIEVVPWPVFHGQVCQSNSGLECSSSGAVTACPLPKQHMQFPGVSSLYMDTHQPFTLCDCRDLAVSWASAVHDYPVKKPQLPSLKILPSCGLTASRAEFPKTSALMTAILLRHLLGARSISVNQRRFMHLGAPIQHAE